MSLLEPAEAAIETPSAPPIGTEAGIGDVAPPQPLRKDVIRRFRRNKLAMFGLGFFVLLVVVAIFAPVVAPYGPTEIPKPVEVRASPSSEHWFGTDNIGRDVFSRVVYGARISLRIGIIATAISLIIGIVLGALSGYFSGLTDTVVMRVTDALLAIPYIILAIAIAALFGRSVNSVILVLGLTGWLAIVRIVPRQLHVAQTVGVRRSSARSATTARGSSSSTSCPTRSNPSSCMARLRSVA